MALHGHNVGQIPNLGEPQTSHQDFIPQSNSFNGIQGTPIDMDALAAALKRRMMGQTPPMDIRHTLFEGMSPFTVMSQDSVFDRQQDFGIPPPFIGGFRG